MVADVKRPEMTVREETRTLIEGAVEVLGIETLFDGDASGVGYGFVPALLLVMLIQGRGRYRSERHERR
jgi:hypothetical protein